MSSTETKTFVQFVIDMFIYIYINSLNKSGLGHERPSSESVNE